MFEPQTHATISASSKASKDKIVFLFAPMPKYLTVHATCNGSAREKLSCNEDSSVLLSSANNTLLCENVITYVMAFLANN